MAFLCARGCYVNDEDASKHSCKDQARLAASGAVEKYRSTAKVLEGFCDVAQHSTHQLHGAGRASEGPEAEESIG